MIFNVGPVSDDAVNFWVAPDNPLGTPRIRVVLDGREAQVMEPSVTYVGLVECGWHSTGLCGFRLTDENCPGLTGAARLEVYDADHNVLVFRRPDPPEAAQAKLFWLDYSTARDPALRALIFPYFATAYFDLHNLPQDTLNSIIQIQHTASLCLAGGLLFRPYEAMIQRNDFLRAVVVEDPFVELAGRLLWLRARAAAARGPQAWRGLGLDAPLAFAAGLDLEDPAELRKAFRRIDVGSFGWLANPLTRHLACHVVGEQPKDAHAQTALDVISRFDLVGHRAHWRPFAASLLDRLGRSAPLPEPPGVPQAVARLARTLRDVRPAHALVAMDLELSGAVASTVERIWADAALA